MVTMHFWCQMLRNFPEFFFHSATAFKTPLSALVAFACSKKLQPVEVGWNKHSPRISGHAEAKKKVLPGALFCPGCSVSLVGAQALAEINFHWRKAGPPPKRRVQQTNSHPKT
eukprot:scaffold192315_cov98-Attheya_sp.AAC.1